MDRQSLFVNFTLTLFYSSLLNLYFFNEPIVVCVVLSLFNLAPTSPTPWIFHPPHIYLRHITATVAFPHWKHFCHIASPKSAPQSPHQPTCKLLCLCSLHLQSDQLSHRSKWSGGRASNSGWFSERLRWSNETRTVGMGMGSCRFVWYLSGD